MNYISIKLLKKQTKRNQISIPLKEITVTTFSKRCQMSHVRKFSIAIQIQVSMGDSSNKPTATSLRTWEYGSYMGFSMQQQSSYSFQDNSDRRGVCWDMKDPGYTVPYRITH